MLILEGLQPLVTASYGIRVQFYSQLYCLSMWVQLFYLICLRLSICEMGMCNKVTERKSVFWIHSYAKEKKASEMQTIVTENNVSL